MERRYLKVGNAFVEVELPSEKPFIFDRVVMFTIGFYAAVIAWFLAN